MKILISCITYDDKIYNFFDQIKSKICYKEDVEFYKLYNDTDLNFVLQNNDCFYKNSITKKNLNFDCSNYDVLGCKEMYEKFYYFCKQIKNLNEYDYVIRCNSSTFLNINLLKQNIQQFPKVNCYAGNILHGTNIISGTCIIFSPDVIKKFIEIPLEQHKYINQYDDVSIALLMNNLKIQPFPINQYYYSFNDRIEFPNESEITNSLNNIIIRVRNNANREKVDTYIWNKLFSSYNFKNKYTNEEIIII